MVSKTLTTLHIYHTKKHGANALSQQGEVGIRTGLHHNTMTQEDKGDWPRQRDVETLSCSIQNLLTSHPLITRVNHKGDAGVSEKQGDILN